MPNRRRKVLVVDNARAIAVMLAMVLEHRGHETATAFSGEEAVQVASSFQPDCIVSELMMGAMSGLEAAFEILNMLPQCKVLFISGTVPPQDLLEPAIAKGFNFDVLLKPVPLPELLSRVSQMFSDSFDQSAG